MDTKKHWLLFLMVTLAQASTAQDQIRLASHVPESPDVAAEAPVNLRRMSVNGRFVLMSTQAGDLISGGGDSNGVEDAYIWDANGGEVTLISHVDSEPQQAANGQTFATAINANGRYVVLYSEATDLASGLTDANELSDVFLWDRLTNSSVLVSHTWNSVSTAGNSTSSTNAPGISADGRYVVFASLATDLIENAIDGVGSEDLFFWDREMNTTVLISRSWSAPATTANAESYFTAMSRDGACVAFQTAATDLVAGSTDANGTYDTFLWNRDSGTATLVSHASGAPATAANGASYPMDISDNCEFLVFRSSASNLVAGVTDTNGLTDAFLFDTVSGTISLISHEVGSVSTTGNGDTLPLQLSADGRFVALRSKATNLHSGPDANGALEDAFRWDRLSNVITLVSRSSTSSSTTANATSEPSGISDDGSEVLFRSLATNLVPGQIDSNSAYGAFLWAADTGEVRLLSHTLSSIATTGNAISQGGWMSPNASAVAISSMATDLIDGTFSVAGHAFRWSESLFSDDFERGDWCAWKAVSGGVPVC